MSLISLRSKPLFLLIMVAMWRVLPFPYGVDGFELIPTFRHVPAGRTLDRVPQGELRTPHA